TRPDPNDPADTVDTLTEQRDGASWTTSSSTGTVPDGGACRSEGGGTMAGPCLRHGRSKSTRRLPTTPGTGCTGISAWRDDPARRRRRASADHIYAPGRRRQGTGGSGAAARYAVRPPSSLRASVLPPTRPGMAVRRRMATTGATWAVQAPG